MTTARKPLKLCRSDEMSMNRLLHHLRSCAFVGIGLALFVVMSNSAGACPICGVPTITLAERYARADAALLVEWVAAKPAQGELPASTTFEIVEVERDFTGTSKAHDRLSVGQPTQGKSGDLFLLLGRKDEKLGVKWDDYPLPVTETSFQYIVQAPSPETAAEKRLAYFAKFLEFPDTTVANDAFGQFVNAPTKDIAAVAEKLPRDKLRRWLADPKTPVNRLAGYGLMLGLCGGPDEARFLEQRIAKTDPERQTGLEGLMFGYLLLAGDAGLAKLQKTYLADPKSEDSETYAAVQAVRYFWTYGNGKISPERLRSAMRLLLDRPTFAENAIVDLARWKDWSLHERLMKLYRASEGDAKLRKAIVSYMIASTKDVANGAKELPPHALAGQKCLSDLRERDPKLVAETEKYFHLQ